MSYAEKQRTAGVVAARTARACDSCLRRRARWFCEADDAFLCHSCDASVHSANPLARRHRRARLHTASCSSPPTDDASDDHSMPPWLHGFKRKPRTPRGKPGRAVAAAKVETLVPDLEAMSAEENQSNEEEQLLHCVPTLDPLLIGFCPQHPLDDGSPCEDDVKPALQLPDFAHVSAADGLAGFRPSDLDLSEFASDMEALLGRGIDDHSFCIDGLGLADATLEDDGMEHVKVEDGDAACGFGVEIALSNDVMDLDYDGRTATMAVQVKDHKPSQEAAAKRRTILRLDYEAVIAAWSSNGCSPWTDGKRPQFHPSDAWADFLRVIRPLLRAGILSQVAGPGGGGEVQGMYQQAGHMAVVDGGREARVSRYREKRRTRLFSKKIRYEVRKLNAEKRPRMKGRFVKQAAFPAAALTFS
ncbi:hypothetical protein B296_00001411 [Ensete ventricosum]|uniref:CCT domain-containing protein n=1 Tax=Ensete ventricosum TaxID=4639 RepID=A0A427AMN0_ENSVE|nr:hypothetical protein B296_00001411 [Ensete ventricosum]